MKWVVTGEQKSLIYEILDGTNAVCGKFYMLTNGFLTQNYSNYDNICFSLWRIGMNMRSRAPPLKKC